MCYPFKWSHSVMSDSLQPHLQPTRLLCPWDLPGKGTRVSHHFLLQGIFPTQGWNPGLPHCRQTLYRLCHQGSPNTGVGSLSLLQQLFPTQESNQGLLHCRQIFSLFFFLTNRAVREALSKFLINCEYRMMIFKGSSAMFVLLWWPTKIFKNFC